MKSRLGALPLVYIRPFCCPLGVTVECNEPQITHEKWRFS